MTTAAVEVTAAATGDAALVGAALADAFGADPVFGWLVTGAGRDRRLAVFFTSMARSYLRRGKPVFRTADGTGAALWSAPGGWELPPAEILRETPAAVRAFGGRVLRALRVQLQVESRHPADLPHWYLGYLGVTTAAQGRGVGSALLREVLDRADAAGLPAYLESSNERNLTLYRRHGFQVVEAFPALGHGPTIWRMWRDPVSRPGG
jgi:GNAT superfamily N-acetyltransferase